MKRLFLTLFLVVSFLNVALGQLPTCAVSGVAYGVNGQPAAGVKIRAVRVEQNGTIVSNVPVETASASDGTWTISVPRSSVVSFCAPGIVASGVSSNCNAPTRVSIPNAATATFSSLLPVITFPTAGFLLKDEGIALATQIGTIDFVGSGVTVVQSAPGVATATITGSGGGGGSLTVQEADGSPSVSAVSTVRFDQADGFVVSNAGTGIARVDLTGVPFSALAALTASRAVVTNGSGVVAASAVTDTELGYLSGVTSAIQTQLTGKAASSHTHATVDVTSGVFAVARIPVMVGATSSVAGTAGAVPAPAAGDEAKFLRGDGAWATVSGGGGGTVTSVALSMPGEFSVSGSPITGAGTLAISKANQNANLVYAGPSSGGAATPAFRALVAADLPAHTHSGTDITGGTVADARLSTNIFFVDGTRTGNSAATTGNAFSFDGLSLTSGILQRWRIPSSGFTGSILKVVDNAGSPATKFEIDGTGKITTGAADAALLTSGTIAAARVQEVLALADLSDVSAKTGAGSTVVMSSSPTLTTPTIADLSNATHTHQNAAGGGTLDAAAIASGSFAKARQHANTVYADQANAYSAGLQDFGSATAILPKSTDPGSPATGQVWINGTALKFRDNGGSPATRTLVDATRSISTGTGLSGGGDLSADRTLSVTNNTTTQRVRVSSAGALQGTRQEVNFIAGSNVTLTVADNAGSDRVDVTIASSGGASGYATVAEEGSALTQRATLNFVGAGLTAADNSGQSRTDVTLSAQLDAFHGLASNGLVTRTAANTIASRSIAAGAGISTTNGDGVGGNPTVAVDLSTLVANQTLWDSSQASRTITFGLSGATDPVLSLSNGAFNISTGVLQQGGTAVALQSLTLTAGAGLTGAGDLSANRTFDVGAGTGITVAADSVAVDQAFTPTWTGLHTHNLGTTPTNAVLLDIAAIGSAGTRDSHNIVLRGRSDDGSAHLTEWRLFNDVTSNAGASTFTIQSRIDAAAFVNRLTITDGGTVAASAFSGDGSALTALNASNLGSGTIPVARGQEVWALADLSDVSAKTGTGSTAVMSTSPTITTPVVAQINDTNGNAYLKASATASAVNEITLKNAATGNAPQIQATGTDTNVSLNLVPKGSGVVQAGGVEVVTLSGAQTLTNKTLTTPTIGDLTNATHSHANPAGGGTLNASAIAAGVLAIARGGTGTGTAPSDGKLLIGKTDGTYAVANLTAGSNVTITNSDGGITIASSGGASGYATVQEEGAGLTQRASLNFVGSGITAADNAGQSRTDVTLNAQLNSLADLASNGLVARTAANTIVARSIAAGAGISITNGDGVSGNPTVAADLSTLVASQTFFDSSQASRTITFGLSGATDPVLTLSNNAFNVSTGVLQQGGTAVALQSLTLTAGAGLTGTGDLSANRTFDVGAGTGISVAADSVAVDQAFAPTWTGLHTFNRGTTPADAIMLTIAAIGSAGTRDSHNIVLRGASDDGSAHTVDWRVFNDVTSNAGASTWRFQSRVDAASFADRLTITDAGTVTAAAFSGDGSALTALSGSNISSGSVANARLDSDLAALGNNSTNGLWAVTGAGTGSARTITGTTNQVNVSNGDGVSGNPTLSLPQSIHTGAAPQFAGLGIGQAAPSAGMALTGKTINTDADGSIAAVDLGFSLTKNDSNTRTFYGWNLKSTLNAGGSNANTTVNVANVDTTNTATTGLTVNLLRLAYGGTQAFLVNSAGNVTAAGTLTVTGAQTLTGATTHNGAVTFNKATVTTPVTLTDAATIATDASLSNRFRVTLGGNRTLGNPTNSTDGQQVVWEIIQDGTGSRTITLGTNFAFGTDITSVTLSTAANKRDYLTAIYNSAATKWYVVGFVKGF